MRGAAEFEQETLESVVEARASVGQVSMDGPPSASEMQTFQEAQGQLTSALSRLLVVVEGLSRATGPRRRSETCKRNWRVPRTGSPSHEGRYTEEVQAYKRAPAFPSPPSLYASMLGLDERAYFEAESGAEDRPGHRLLASELRRLQAFDEEGPLPYPSGRSRRRGENGM